MISPEPLWRIALAEREFQQMQKRSEYMRKEGERFDNVLYCREWRQKVKLDPVKFAIVQEQRREQKRRARRRAREQRVA